MLQATVMMIFLGAGMVSLAVIAAMLMDHKRQILAALGFVTPQPVRLPALPSRVRIVRNPRLAPMSPLPLREAA